MIEGLHCAACVWLIENVLKKQPNLIEEYVNGIRNSMESSGNKARFDHHTEV